MIATAARLTFLINRFETRAIGLATVVAVVVTVAVVSWMRQSGYVDCLNAFSATVECLQIGDLGGLMDRIARASLAMVPFFPFVAGLLLGVPVVARELDRGTARLAWSLSPSRLRWFLQRLVPLLVLVLGASVAIGLAGEWLTGVYWPDTDLSRSFVGFHERGLLIVANALLIAAIGVFVGSLIGRPLPALIVAAVLAGLTLVAVSEVHKRVMSGESVALEETANMEFSNDHLYLDGRIKMPDGSLLTWDEAVAVDPAIMNGEAMYPWVQLIIPGNRYRAIELREATIEIVLAGAYLLAAGAVVARRRPG